MNGVLRTERARHAKELKEVVASKDSEIETLRAKVRELEAAQAANAPIDLKAHGFTDDNIELLGREQAEALARAQAKTAREAAQKVVEEQLRPERERRERDAKAAQALAEQGFLDALTEAVPTWQAINATDGWKEWLGELDEATGEVRDEIIQRAQAQLKSAPIARLFRQYMATLNPAHVPAAPPVAPAGGQSAGIAGGNEQGQPVQGYVSRAEAREFYKRAATNKPLPVTDAERAQFDARVRTTMSAYGRLL